MDTTRRWKLSLIVTVLILTFYNILPTLFYYSQPLKKPITLFEAESIAQEIEERVASLEKENIDWLHSYCKLLNISPVKIELSSDATQIIVECNLLKEAKRLRHHLPKALSFIPFAKMTLAPQEETSKKVSLFRSVPGKLSKEFFHYAPGKLVLDQKELTKKIYTQLASSLEETFTPTHPDFKKEKALTSFFDEENNAIYVNLEGAEKLAKLYQNLPENDLTHLYMNDLQNLAGFLLAQGFQITSPLAAPQKISKEGDLCFIKTDLIHPFLVASREEFRFENGSYFLPLTCKEDRILTKNRIDNEVQKELIRWKEDYQAAQVHIDETARFDVPKPTKSAFWNNIALSVKKYFRGDERKVLKWGLDLSGGKNLLVELYDHNGEVVTKDLDIKKGIEELTKRVNKLGVSEVSIRQIGHQISLDFPGSQGLSAKDLLKASSMSFHLVNETFSLNNGEVRDNVQKFLQKVWQEAIVLNQKDSDGINQIAKRVLANRDHFDFAQKLFEKGFRLEKDDSENLVSKIGLLRGDDKKEWQGQNHPLIILFDEAALEGKSLCHIRSGYDATKGNFLTFDVQEEKAKDKLYSWASKYCKESILGTSLESLTHQRGWRMAAVLNDTVISTPSLEAPLRESAMITGSFSPREVAKLAADLEAGTLSFTPKIIAEKNIHPELGKEDRMKGILSTLLALILVIGAMVIYYRFAGIVASIAVFFNLLILWAILQNLEAVLTLGSIAGIILTVGMAVDANVLVFERIKEELKRTSDLKLSLQAGYQKAYSAILDSNLTTIIAAVILLNFDAGPIKSFALNLLIGIISSMFTALFMTKFYFERWAVRNKTKTLSMKNWIDASNFPFLQWAKPSFAIAALILFFGSFSLFQQKETLLGIDFTGGYSLELELQSGDARKVKEALSKEFFSSQEFQVQQLQPETHVRIFLSSSIETTKKMFGNLSLNDTGAKIDSILNVLRKDGLEVTKECAKEIHSHFNALSSQVSDTMKNQAIFGLCLALLAIFVYLAIRFEYRFALAALFCLFHDLFITLASIGLLHLLGVKIQIDLTTIAALMTIIGYSLNDTIIIFDRIREEMTAHPYRSLSSLVNSSLNHTLSRTTITSGTTLLVLIALVSVGGASLFNFSITMAIGVFFGTLSSWFIASPLLVWLHRDLQKAPSQ